MPSSVALIVKFDHHKSVKTKTFDYWIENRQMQDKVISISGIAITEYCI